MTTITTHDLPVHLPDVYARLAAGEEFLVTDHGKPVARILPAAPETVPPPATAEEWVAQWLTWTDSHPRREIVFDDGREAIYAGCGE